MAGGVRFDPHQHDGAAPGIGLVRSEIADTHEQTEEHNSGVHCDRRPAARQGANTVGL